jgi:hypothetical protein
MLTTFAHEVILDVLKFFSLLLYHRVKILEPINPAQMGPLILSEFDAVGNVDDRADVKSQLDQQDETRLALYKVLAYARLCLLQK